MEEAVQRALEGGEHLRPERRGAMVKTGYYGGEGRLMSERFGGLRTRKGVRGRAGMRETME